MSTELTRDDEAAPADSGADGASLDDTSSATSGQRMPGTDSGTESAGDTNEVAPIEDDSDRPRVSTVLSITAVAFAVAAMALQPTYAIPGALLGAVGVAYAVVRRHRSILGPSTVVALASVLFHGAIGGSAFGTVAAAGLVVFAWDQADNAFDLDAHLGPDAPVVRGEVAHAIYSFAVTAIAGGGVFAIALLAANQRPLPALVVLLLGAILLLIAIRDH